MNIDVKRLPADSRAMSILLYDKEINVTPNTKFKVFRTRLIDSVQEMVAEIDPNTESSVYLVHHVGDDIIIELVDNPNVYGTTFLYRAWRVGETGITEEATPFVEVYTLPNKVDNFRMVDELSTFDEAGIPRYVYLAWDKYNYTTDNYDVIGFHIYYSVADRNQENWTNWEKLRGNTTDPYSSFGINFIDKDDQGIEIFVPQLFDYNTPKDMKFAIVAVTGGANPLQSRFSRVEMVSLKNKMVVVVTPGEASTVILPADFSGDPESSSVLTLPLRVDFKEDAFANQATVLIERLPYDPEITSFDFRYTYELRATESFNKYALVSMYLTIPSDAKYEVRVEKNGQWVTVPCTYDKDTTKVTFALLSPSKFVLLVKSASLIATPRKSLEAIFNEYTDKLISRLPTWFKMRKNPTKSNGAYFLEVAGLELQEMKFILDYAERQTHLGTADIDQIDVVYKVRVPYDVKPEYVVTVSSSGFALEQTSTLDDFLAAPYKNSDTPEVYYNNQYVIDYDENIIYTRKSYNETTDKPLGDLEVSLFIEGQIVPFYRETLDLEMHHVWNFFDEFGLLLNTPRLYGERNAKYKERLFDVFKNKSNSSREGLMNGIARELGIRINTVWKDNHQDFVIKDPMVIVNMIKINGEYVSVKDIWFSSEDYIVIKANPGLYPENSEVTYVSGLEMHTFTNKDDNAFQQQLYNINGTATKLFRHYVDTIKQRVPVEWGQFKWNEGYWDAGLPSVGGYGYLPSIMDADITGFRPILVDLISQPKPMSITIEETVQLQRYDRRSAL